MATLAINTFHVLLADSTDSDVLRMEGIAYDPVTFYDKAYDTKIMQEKYLVSGKSYRALIVETKMSLLGFVSRVLEHFGAFPYAQMSGVYSDITMDPERFRDLQEHLEENPNLYLEVH